jgi:hypothetical protein
MEIKCKCVSDHPRFGVRGEQGLTGRCSGRIGARWTPDRSRPVCSGGQPVTLRSSLPKEMVE